MARTVKEQEYAGKRNEILATAQRLVFTKGYERMTIQDIRDELKISSGAFYHYFGSKPAVLEAMIEQMQQEVEQPLLPIIEDTSLSAIEKLQRFFATLDSSRTAQKAFISNLARVWFADDNAIVREKVDEALVERRMPLLTKIVRQGVQEGVFTTPYPEQAGGIILSLARGMGNTLVKLMLLLEQKRNEAQIIEEIVNIYAAYANAIERILGVSAPFLDRIDDREVREWLVMEDATAN